MGSHRKIAVPTTIAESLGRCHARLPEGHALTAQGAGVLLVAKRDRLARDVIVSAVVERLVERQGARVMAADGTGNGDSPEAELMRRIADAFSVYAELRNMRSSVIRSLV